MVIEYRKLTTNELDTFIDIVIIYFIYYGINM